MEGKLQAGVEEIEIFLRSSLYKDYTDYISGNLNGCLQIMTDPESSEKDIRVAQGGLRMAQAHLGVFESLLGEAKLEATVQK